MNYSELLYNWLDGSLASEHEEALFIALGKDAALRAEMQDLMRLQSAVRNDTAAFTPDPADTGAIFAKLGFAVPAGIPATLPSDAPVAASVGGISTTAAASKFLIKALFKRFALGFGSALASAVLASLITILLLDWRNGNRNGNSNGMSNGNSSAWNNAAPLKTDGNTLPPPLDPNGAYFQAMRNGGIFATSDTSRINTRSQESFQSNLQRVIVREIVHEVVRYTSPYDLFSNPTRYSGSANSSSESSSNQGLQEQTALLKETLQELRAYKTSSDKQTQQSSPILASTATLDSATSPKTSSQERVQTPSLPQNEQGSGIQEILHKIRLGVRGITNIPLTAPTLEPTTSALSFLNNVALSLHYALTPHHSIGIEAGQEAYFQQYRTTENQDSYMVSQYPTQVWGGVSYRYTFLPEQAFTPFAGATIGLAEYGVMGRTQIGCSYAPDGITQFVLGVEASSLFYGHQGANYFSPKLGVTYGVSVRF